MADAIRFDESFSIVSATERALGSLRTLKHDDTFAMFDAHGDIRPSAGGEHGLFHRGTRHLSLFELRLGTRRPLLLSSTISDDNAVFAADLTNPDFVKDGHVVLPHSALHLFRTRVVAAGGMTERVRVANHGRQPVEIPIALRVDADFVDIFEVRGTKRARRGQRLADIDRAGARALRYRGLDGIERSTRVVPGRTPDRVDDEELRFVFDLEPHATAEIEIIVACEADRHPVALGSYDDTLRHVRQRCRDSSETQASVLSSNEGLNRWLRRSRSDLRMMTTDTVYGPYPYAGIPWFSTPFGRDGLITAFELLWAAPEFARGVLSFLAATQATAVDDAADAQPGKILHEMRDGEMAALGEIPFGRYYGTVDATPLFVALAAAYAERTDDRKFVDRLWPHVLAALDWMERDGDVDADGFVEYARRSEKGLVQQGWKDSFDSVFHADGTLADPPIALCEVQGYVYAAWRGAGAMARLRGDVRGAAAFEDRAARLASDFERAFWCDELGTYALALDADKRQCRIRTSNPAHCLFTGLASAERARAVAASLVSETLFSGWGVRTVAAGAARYNPMSYHNGSVWPHDNALAAAGLARYGYTNEATRIFSAMFDLSQAVDLHRLPELVCGFQRHGADFPTLYPVACAPQAWAAGAVYLLLESCLGLRVNAIERRVTFARAILPESVDWIRLEGLRVGAARLDLLLTRHRYDVGVTVLRREGAVDIVALK
jgi:glycogen debranching enzyme